MQVTMSNHKSTESALKNLEVQVGQLAKQIANKSSNSFVANTEQNPKEECKVVMTRSKRFVEVKDEDSVVHKKKTADKKGTDGKKNEFNEFKVELERQNLHKCLAKLQEGSIDVAMVKEFYANFYSPTDQAPKCARIRGHLIRIDADSLNEFLQTPVLLEEGKSLPTYSRFCRLRSDPREMEASLCIPGKGFILNTKGQPWKLLRKDLTTMAQTWSVFSYSNLAPTSRTSDFNTDRARLVYGLITRMDMNIGSLISGQMTMMAQSNSSRLGFPALITALCRLRGVGSNALISYENLRPVIDLAYIIRNCWNANDQTANFPEARKTKLRAVDVPSSFAPIAGIPASSTSAPLPALADLSAQSSQTSDAKLQSLFEGQILIMQSLQELAQQRPIMSVEQLIGKVVWLGARPSFVGDNESFTAQAPQQHELEPENDHLSEAIIPGAVDFSKRKVETRSNKAAHPGPVLVLAYVPFLGMDPSSPQHAANSSTRILEIPEGQTTPVLALDTSPLATPVLHLTDKEDV
ncbi:hypothetical protein HKD37_15G043525 [Glycine soja]